MEIISYEKLQDVKRKIELGQELDNTDKKIEEILSQGRKHASIIENILKENDIDEEQLMQYSQRISKLIEKVGFASAFLVKELPDQYIDSFDRTKWQAVTKIVKFPQLDYESQKACLMICGTYGIFEKDENANKRAEQLKNALQTIPLEKCSEFKMFYEPSFLDFFKRYANQLSTEQLTTIQNKWDEIQKSVEIKNVENILKYIEVSSKSNNRFENYMEVNGIPKSLQEKYRIIYEHMAGRTKTSIPTCRGKNESGYSYEVLNFNDPRILRFGNDNLVKCCQKIGGNGEGSMINSAIESSSRVLMVSDESGELIAGSLVTHQIGKDGKSHVCFDSIEVNAKRARIKAADYQITLKRIEQLKKKGIIKDGTIEELRNYYETTPSQKCLITKDDLKALEVNRKILDVYKQASEDMIVADEKKRTEQLRKGEISNEEYSHLLMKNGLFTIGRNPVSMYLGSLERLDKKSMEKLPALQKDRSIYKKAGHNSFEKGFKKSLLLAIDTMAAASIALTALSLVPAIGGATIGIIGSTAVITGGAILSHKIVNRKKVQGVYTDSSKEQRVLIDGRKKDDEDNSKETVLELDKQKQFRKQLEKDLVYDEMQSISNPIEVSKLTEEDKKKLSQLYELANNKESKLSENAMVIGNLENWAALFTNKDGNLILKDVLLPNPMSFSKNERKLTDAQKELLQNIQNLPNLEVNCEDKRVNKYLSKAIAKSKSMQEQKNAQRQIPYTPRLNTSFEPTR